MHSLYDLLRYLEKNKPDIEIKDYTGVYLDTDLGRFSMIHDKFYLNRKPIKRSEIKEIKKPVDVQHKSC